MSTRTHIVLPDGLLERVDVARGDVPRSRWLVRAVEAMLLIVEDGALEKAPSGGERFDLLASGPAADLSPAERRGSGQAASSRASKDQKLEMAREVLKKAPSIRETWAR